MGIHNSGVYSDSGNNIVRVNNAVFKPQVMTLGAICDGLAHYFSTRYGCVPKGADPSIIKQGLKIFIML